MDKAKSIVQEVITHNTLFPYIQHDTEACEILQSELERLTIELFVLKARNALPDSYINIDQVVCLRSHAFEGKALSYGLSLLLATHNLLSSVPNRRGSQIGAFFNNVYRTIFAMVSFEVLSLEELTKSKDKQNKAKQRKTKGKRKKRSKSINPTEEGGQRTSKTFRDNEGEFTAHHEMRRKHSDS